MESAKPSARRSVSGGALVRSSNAASPQDGVSSSTAKGVEVGQHSGGVSIDVIDVVGAADDAVGIDQERMSVGVVDVGSAGPDHSVSRTDRAVDVGQQGEREPLGVAEGAVLLRGVE